MKSTPTDQREPEVVDTARAAEIVGLARSTLETLRSRGGGPPFLKVRKRVVYRVADLREWRDRGLATHTGVTPENGGAVQLDPATSSRVESVRWLTGTLPNRGPKTRFRNP